MESRANTSLRRAASCAALHLTPTALNSSSSPCYPCACSYSYRTKLSVGKYMLNLQASKVKVGEAEVQARARCGSAARQADMCLYSNRGGGLGAWKAQLRRLRQVLGAVWYYRISLHPQHLT